MPVEILTVADLASMLKMSKGQIYEMTKERTRTGAMRDNPIPVLKINGNVRFRKSDVEEWIEKIGCTRRVVRKTLDSENNSTLLSGVAGTKLVTSKSYRTAQSLFRGFV